MKRMFRPLASLVLLIFAVAPASAAQIKAYVAGFSVTGVEKREELKPALQTLLASRLSGQSVAAVDSPQGADVAVTGSYVVFGRIFSLDAVAKNAAGSVVARAFVQGDSENELIPAMGKLASLLAGELGKIPSTLVAAPLQQAAPVAEQPRRNGDIVQRETPPPPAASEIVRAEEPRRTAGGNWMSQRLTGPLVGMAVGRTLPSGEQEIFLAGKHAVGYYLKGKDLRPVAEATLPAGEKVLAIDTADLDGDGVPEVYVTAMSGGFLASQVWVPGEKSLKKVAQDLPYFFRAIALGGKEKKLYAQEMTVDGEFYGDVSEVVRAGSAYKLANPIKVPKGAYLYNFNRFTDGKGNQLFVLVNRDGYLLVCSDTGEELWRSSDKFGGSEIFYQRGDQIARTTGTISSLSFLEQRMVVTPSGDIIVPQNAGFWVVGNFRSYAKSSLFSFAWNGSSLEEKWHTKQSQNYLADFAYDDAKKELASLEVTQKEGLVEKGASVVVVKKVE